MAKLNEETIPGIFAPHLNPGEELKHYAYGVKQPPILLIILLVALAVLPGVIAIALLTKQYLLGITDRRLIALDIKGNGDVKGIVEYSMDEIRSATVKTSTGGLFTHIRVEAPEKRFIAKFHRAFAKFNRPNAMAIAAAIDPSAKAA